MTPSPHPHYDFMLRRLENEGKQNIRQQVFESISLLQEVTLNSISNFDDWLKNSALREERVSRGHTRRVIIDLLLSKWMMRHTTFRPFPHQFGVKIFVACRPPHKLTLLFLWLLKKVYFLVLKWFRPFIFFHWTNFSLSLFGQLVVLFSFVSSQ